MSLATMRSGQGDEISLESFLKKLLSWAAAIGLVMLGACYKQPPLAEECKCALQRPLRVGILTWPGFAGGIVANHGFRPNAKSFFAQNQICVEFSLLEDVEDRRRALKGGRDGVDAVWATIDELPMFLRDDDVKAKVIMQVDWSQGGDAIVAAKDIHRIEDLYKKKVALALYTPSHWLLENFLKRSTLEPKQQIEITKSLISKKTSQDAREAFVAKKVDAAVVWEPDVTQAIRDRPGSHILGSTRDAPRLIADVMLVREDLLTREENEKAIEGFVAGWIVDGANEANKEQNKDKIIRLLRDNENHYKELNSQKTGETLENVKLANLLDNTELFNIDEKHGVPGFNSLFDKIYTNAAESWVARGYITPSSSSRGYRDPEDVKDVRFIRSIYRNKFWQISSVGPPAIIVNFAPGEFALNQSARNIIDDKVSLLPKAVADSYYIEVQGNTDTSRGPESNKTLSKNRASAVVDYLAGEHHLPRQLFTIVASGPDQPIASNDTPEGRASNRRVEVRVRKKG